MEDYVLTPPDYVVPPPGYVLPTSGYVVPPPGYVLPPPGYVLPPPGYVLPPQKPIVQANWTICKPRVESKNLGWYWTCLNPLRRRDLYISSSESRDMVGQQSPLIAMNYILLVNVFEYFDREDLEKLSTVSRLFEKVVRTEFLQHPFRVFNKLDIVTDTNGDIGLGMRHDGIALEITSIVPPEANVAEFKAGLTEGFRHDVRYFSVRAMLPFMGKSVRFERTIIEVNSTLISQQSITAMENFAHLWTGRILELRHGYDVITPSDTPDEYIFCFLSKSKFFASNEAIIPNCDRIFNSPGIITPCRELEIYRIDAPINYPALYALQMIKISEVHEFSADNLLSFVEEFSKYNSRTQLVCFSRVDFQRTHLGKIREAFSNAKETHAWKLVLVDQEIGLNKLFFVDRQFAKMTEFRDEYLLTKEVLELRLTDTQMKENLCISLGIFNCSDFWILERKPLS
ncbi:hypothetical protein Ddc_14612 [Ditylenchus destructor]|nr:hypothetical protein Ddc_14612 [Ditylenchus destructor]